VGEVVRIDLAYDGGGFHGWQVQPGLRTVQGELARMCRRLLGREAVPVGAGRTDTGVHALGQVASLDGLTADEADRLVRALARLAPEDVEILAVRPAAAGFHARFSARWRRYLYRIGLRRDLFRRRYRWQPPWPLDREAMQEAARLVLGEHDFSSFCKSASLREDNTCRVTASRWLWEDDEAVYWVQADRFLHHMVRNLVGTMVEIGRGARPPESMADILAARDRRSAGTMAPPQGLYLAAVGYDDDPAGPPPVPTHDRQHEERT